MVFSSFVHKPAPSFTSHSAYPLNTYILGNYSAIVLKKVQTNSKQKAFV